MEELAGLWIFPLTVKTVHSASGNKNPMDSIHINHKTKTNNILPRHTPTKQSPIHPPRGKEHPLPMNPTTQ